MKRRPSRHALIAVLAITAPAWIGLNECQADTTIADIVKNDGGKFTVGGLTFTFTDTSVSSDTFGDNYTPTASNVLVTAVTGGVEFSLDQMATLRGKVSQTDKITITYSVAAGKGIGAAGLSFTGFAMGIDASSSVTETFPDGHNESINVFTTAVDDDPSHNKGKNNQSASFSDKPMTLSVQDVGQLSIPNRGGPGESDTQLTSMTNTFTIVPEPSSFVLASTAGLVGLGVWWHRRKRAAAL
jgi:hypothetical protein